MKYTNEKTTDFLYLQKVPLTGKSSRNQGELIRWSKKLYYFFFHVLTPYKAVELDTQKLYSNFHPMVQLYFMFNIIRHKTKKCVKETQSLVSDAINI